MLKAKLYTHLLLSSLIFAGIFFPAGCSQLQSIATGNQVSGKVMVPTSEISGTSLSSVRPNEVNLSPLANATVTLTDAFDTKLGEGTTNEKGEYAISVSISAGATVMARAEKESGDKKIVASSSIAFGNQQGDINPTTTARSAKIQELILSKVGDLHKQGTITDEQKKVVDQFIGPLITTISELISQVTSDT